MVWLIGVSSRLWPSLRPRVGTMSDLPGHKQQLQEGQRPQAHRPPGLRKQWIEATGLGRWSRMELGRWLLTSRRLWALSRAALGRQSRVAAAGGSRCLQLENVCKNPGVGEGSTGWRWQPKGAEMSRGGCWNQGDPKKCSGSCLFPPAHESPRRQPHPPNVPERG